MLSNRWIQVCAFVIAAAGGCFAAETTPGQATAAVTGWLRENNTPLNVVLGQPGNVSQVKDAAGKTQFHVVSLQPSGFALVAADDRIEPIIAFSDSGSFHATDQNPLFTLAFEDQKRRLQNLNNAAGRRETDAAGKWKFLTEVSQTLRAGSRGAPSISDVRVPQLIYTVWDQALDSDEAWYCYNYCTPNNYLSGCVATAMAQLMRYHQYPVTGVGTASFGITVDSLPFTYRLGGGDFNGGPYNWGLMPLNPSAATTDEQRRAIGLLCYDAGVASHMNYSANGSGAWLSDAAIALRTTFRYSRAVCGGNTYNIGNGLVAMVNTNLDARLPVLFHIGTNGQAGRDAEHAIVCDGYGMNGNVPYHHLNLGWGGNSNAWYQLFPPYVDTDGYFFSSVRACVYNIFESGSGEIVSGRVTTSNGAPIAGVSVKVNGSFETVTTSEFGVYALRVASNTTYTLSATKPGYTFTSMTVKTGLSADSSSVSGNVWGADLVGTDAVVATPTITSVLPTSGPLAGGTPVTITGTNFTGATAVYFGVAPAASFTVNSPTQITAIAPPQTEAGLVSVAVTVTGSTAIRPNAYNFTVVLSKPAITGSTPILGPLAGGTSVAITGLNFTSNVTVKFGSKPATGVVVNGTSQITCLTPANAAGAVDITVINTDGQSVTLPNAFAYRDLNALVKDVPVSANTSGGRLFYYFDVPAGVSAVTFTTSSSSTEDILNLGVNGPDHNFNPEDIYSSDVFSNWYDGNEFVVFNNAPAAGRYHVLVDRSLNDGPGGAFSIVASYYTGGQYYPLIDYLYPPNGVMAGGSLVVVYGDYFSTTGNVSVTFGGIQAPYVEVDGSGTAIYCETPAHAAGLVDVRVTNADGRTDLLSPGFVFNTPIPLYNGVSENWTSIYGDVPCYFDVPEGVSSVTIKTTNTTGDVLDLCVNGPARGNWPPTPYLGDVAIGIDSGNETAEFKALPAASGRYYILVGQYGSGGPFTITATFTAATNLPPVITSGPFATPNPATVNELITFSVYGYDPEGANATFDCDFGDGSAGGITHAYSAAGVYTVTVTVTDQLGATTKKTVSVTVNSYKPVLLQKGKFVLNFKSIYKDGLDVTFAGPPLRYDNNFILFLQRTNGPFYVWMAGDYVDEFTLFAGKGGSGKYTKVKWDYKKGEVRYTMKNVVVSDLFAEYGATNSLAFFKRVEIPMFINAGGTWYGDNYRFTYKASPGKTGSGKK